MRPHGRLACNSTRSVKAALPILPSATPTFRRWLFAPASQFRQQRLPSLAALRVVRAFQRGLAANYGVGSARDLVTMALAEHRRSEGSSRPFGGKALVFSTAYGKHGSIGALRIKHATMSPPAQPASCRWLPPTDRFIASVIPMRLTRGYLQELDESLESRAARHDGVSAWRRLPAPFHNGAAARDAARAHADDAHGFRVVGANGLGVL